MKTKSLIFLSCIAAALLSQSCGTRSGWSVSGHVDGAEGRKLALQAFNNNSWYTIDSLAVDSKGKYEYRSATPAAFPEVLRLALDGENIYFPVDSVDEITISSDASSFGRAYSLYGTPTARCFATIDSLIAATVAEKGEAAAATDSLMKRNLAQLIIASNDPLASYYVVNKRIGGQAVFNPASKRDLAVIGAAAQCFESNLPDDPRTASLRALFLSSKVAANPGMYEPSTVEIPESGLSADIKAYDNRGKAHSLYDVASKGNVVLLSFTDYRLDSSAAYNVLLADLYKKYNDKGLEIFQVAFDDNEAEWKQSAVNLPWITVWHSPEDGNAVLTSYNVNILPLTYIIDRDGVLKTRVVDPTTLEKELKGKF